MTRPRPEDTLSAAATEASAPRTVDELLADAPETELDEGDRLGAWRLVRRLAHGGMGAVYLAERADGHFEQRAAIKLIRGVPDAEMLAHFTRERQILATLQHPDIARLLDGGATPGGQPYLVMEYVEGAPIDVWCRERALPLDRRLALFERVCDAVQFAHQRFVVHCDLKPSNVLVRDDGTPVLLDFGIARALDRQHAVDKVEAGYFTPGYASPEQLRGDAVTTASDVYALGLILFELVAGRKARVDAQDRTIAELGDAAVRPSEIAEAVPWRKKLAGDLDAIVLRATAADPAQRYAGAASLAEDIRRHRALRPVVARAPTFGYRMGRLLRRRWPAFAVGALIIAVVATFTWRLAAERDRARAAEHEARVQAATASRVSDFLVSVFDVSNPRVNQKRDISARDVLDEGASRIHAELGGEPRVKAKLLKTLATAYRFIGRPGQSIDLFRQAIELDLDPRVADPLAAAAALSQLSVLYSNNSYPHADAEAAARRSLELRTRNAAPPLAIADAYNTLGIALEGEDRYDEARDVLKRALALRRENGADASSVASSLHNLGLVAASSGHFEEAIADYREALDLRRSTIGEHHPEYQATLNNYGMTLAHAGRSADAVPVLEKNLALARELYGEASVHTATAHNELGSAMHDLGRFADASAHYREAIRIEKAAEGEGNPDYAKPLNNLASAYEDMGDFASAVPLFEQSLAIRRKALPADDPMVLRAEYNLARAETKAGALAAAKPLLDEARAGFRKRFGDADASTAKVVLWTGEWQLRSGDIDAAQAALAALDASQAHLAPLIEAQRFELSAGIARARHDADAEVAARRSAWETMRDAWGAAHPLSAEFAIEYADALARAGRGSEAAEVAGPEAPIVEAAFAANAPVRRMAQRWL